MKAKTLMVVGSMSSAGKSLLVTALCRLFSRRGLRVAPYKSQNMSNNAAVCPDGSEIGRAQYTQALACGIVPTAEMNPILLKPEADAHSQVVVMGKPWASLPAREYYLHKTELWEIATQSLDSLRQVYDLVIIEGAGSPVELNLKDGDIVNMSIAKYADSPVLLVGDIDRGGIFAQLLGTLWLFEENEERNLIKGLLINKFRGDITLFYDGIKILEDKGKVPVIGIIPYTNHHIPEEDAVAIEKQNWKDSKAGMIDIVIPRLPRIANFDDFDILMREPGVRLRYIDSPTEIGRTDALILPGTKSTISDLNWLHTQGFVEWIQDFAVKGGSIVGICGGYQMLGHLIHDATRIESDVRISKGIGLLEIETDFQGEKATHQMEGIVHCKNGWLSSVAGNTIKGYEIHMGKTSVNLENALMDITQRSGNTISQLDGFVSNDGRIWGCYIHGLFENHKFRRAWLKSLGWESAPGEELISLDQSFDQIADVLEKSLDMTLLEKIIGLEPQS
ncbi:MAG: cobyric acid synthase [Anaerolineaceae bacterium]|nr:cobyric acid synthase [Anaerolineaceae bacterium]